MTSLRFIGDLALWQGVLLALAIGLFSWWLYWRETQVLNGAVRWLLPTLRSAAIVLALLVLTAPVLHHRYREGEPGRLRFLVDSSRSMSINDRHFDQASKLSIAQSLGWMSSSSPSGVSTEPASSSATGSATSTATNDLPPMSLEAIERFDNSPRYARAVERLLTADGGVLSSLQDEFEIVVERFDRGRTKLWESTLSETSPLPTDPQAWVPAEYPNATQLGVALVGGSASTNVTTNTNPSTGPENSTDKSLQTLETNADETLVLLSDGRNTAGASPLAVAENLATQRRPVYVIGLGGSQTPADINLVSIEHPERVFERDLLRGTLVIRQRMPQVAPLKLSIRLANSINSDNSTNPESVGEVLWEETRTLSGSDRGRVDFAFPVKPIVEKLQKLAGRGTNFTSVPLHLVASIESQPGEGDQSNNSRTFHVSVVTKRSRLLLVDGRSRWETRYLHNMFERDPAWQVDLVLPDQRETPPRLPRGTDTNQWPSTKERLLEYDLVILGELPPNTMPKESVEWLKSFVESSGGGLIIIDGARGMLRDASYKPIQSMLPIEWVEDKRVKPDPVLVRLTSTARQLAAFQLTPNDPAKNEAAWNALPPLHMTSAVKALPGSEVLATYAQESEEIPLMVTRQFGAGRVFYSGTDETWRWRFKVADTYHQRFWNQIGRWVMRLPMSVQGQFVAIDSGKLVYQPGETITLRSRLRNAQGDPAIGLTVEAVVTAVQNNELGNLSVGPDRAGATATNTGAPRVIAVVPLTAEPAIAGVYSGQITAPIGGNYHVSIVAPGLTEDALAIYSEFSVVEPESGEMDQLNCDEALLKKLAEVTGGRYLSEEQGHELADLLRPLSRGKIVESDTLLWQSYWW
ncbi:MAG: hypothetical protein IT423_13960, partial [Pirellulaceae bacterium]|nr:hypothetical protein [Pirellulaceae bacterium]